MAGKLYSVEAARKMLQDRNTAIIAREIGVANNTVRFFKTGKTKSLGGENYAKLCAYLEKTCSGEC